MKKTYAFSCCGLRCRESMTGERYLGRACGKLKSFNSTKNFGFICPLQVAPGSDGDTQTT
eukprot:5000113-Amphidinium_carterae.1